MDISHFFKPRLKEAQHRFFGLILTIVGVLPLRLLYVWLTQGGTILDVQLLVLAAILLGIWLIKGSLRKSHFIFVEAATDKRKLIFDGNIDTGELKSFLENAKSTWQYKITSSI